MRRLEIAYECQEEWDSMEARPGGSAMRPHGSTRFCDRCEKPVHDLSAMRAADAKAFLMVFGSGPLCVRYEVDELGAMRFAPEPRPHPRQRRAGIVAAALGVAAASGCAGPAPMVAQSTNAPRSSIASPPPPDRDGDGFADSVDRCPDEVGFRLDPPGRTDCPEDTDRDGVMDPVDACPREPGEVSSTPSQNGCPRRFVGIIVTGQIQILEAILFKQGSAKTQVVSEPILDAIARTLAGNPEIRRIAVRGHASSDEPNPARLSLARAERVVKALVAHGVDPGRLGAEGLGKDHPIDANLTAAGRARNRRVDFDITDPGATCPTPTPP